MCTKATEALSTTEPTDLTEMQIVSVALILAALFTAVCGTEQAIPETDCSDSRAAALAKL